MLGGTRYYFHTIVRAKNRIGPHNEEIISVLIGLLLGDGYANNRTGEGVRIAIKQSIIHKEYLFLLFKFFQERGYCTNNPPRLYIRKLKNDQFKINKSRNEVNIEFIKLFKLGYFKSLFA